MIRGVNKHIIEINELDSEHFYKAILFVKPESEKIGQEKLHKCAASAVIDAVTLKEPLPIGFLRRRRRKKRLIIGGGIAFFLLAVAVLFIILF